MLRKIENSSNLVPKGTLDLEIVMFYKYYAPTALLKTDININKFTCSNVPSGTKYSFINEDVRNIGYVLFYNLHIDRRPQNFCITGFIRIDQFSHIIWNRR